jgi:hypothetical protein
VDSSDGSAYSIGACAANYTGNFCQDCKSCGASCPAFCKALPCPGDYTGISGCRLCKPGVKACDCTGARTCRVWYSVTGMWGRRPSSLAGPAAVMHGQLKLLLKLLLQWRCAVQRGACRGA